MRALAPIAALLLSGVLPGCGDDGAPVPEAVVAPPPPPPPRGPVMAPRRVASDAAFELVATGEGAMLFWGMPGRMGGGLRYQRLDAYGSVRGEEGAIVAGVDPALYPPDTVEVAAASQAGRVGVAWLDRLGDDIRVRAAVGDLAGEAFGPTRQLGSTQLDSVGHRGNVEVVASGEGAILVRHRGPLGPCLSGQTGRGCTLVPTVRVDGDEPRQRMGPRAIPRPCPGLLLGTAFVGRDLYSGTCTVEDGVPLTFVLGLQFDPELAQPAEVLRGCQPLGVVSVASAAVAVARCGGERKAVLLRDATQVVTDLGPLRADVTCEGATPTIHLGEDGRVTLPLTGPRSDLAPILPDHATFDGARAVWTGSSVLVARSIGGEVQLIRYECEAGQLNRTSL